MKRAIKDKINLIFGFAVLILLAVSTILFLRAVWSTFTSLETTLAVGILTAATTIIAATVTNVVGRYYERKKEIESHFRQTKVSLYDEFLKKFFSVFYSSDSERGEKQHEHLVSFLREWQRKMILWGDAKALNAFIKWKGHLIEPDAQSIFLLEEFIKALRTDIGLSNRHLTKGTLAKLILRNPDVFLALAREDPDISLREVARKEKELGLE